MVYIVHNKVMFLEEKRFYIDGGNIVNIRKNLEQAKRIVIKIGSSSLTHEETGNINFMKLEILVREICDLRNQGKEVVLVSSGAIPVGKQTMGLAQKVETLSEKQACAAVGQARLMMIYQKLFSEYNQIAGQILMTKSTFTNDVNRRNAKNTFQELLTMGVVPIVNENDTISTYEIEHGDKFGDNDTLSAIVSALIEADLLILLSDIDGLFTDDPHKNPDAEFITHVESINADLLKMGKDSSSSGVGTGGMATKLRAATIATAAGADMLIANGEDLHIIHKLIQGEDFGTLFIANKEEDFYLTDYVKRLT